MKFAFLIPIFVSIATAQIDHDWSLKTLCEFHGSQYTQRPNGGQSEVGDKCQFVLPVSTANERMAEKFCKIHIPYHINSVVYGIDRTECHAEATLICKYEWVQFYGRCYKAFKTEMMKYDDARAKCKKENGDIAFLHRKELVRHWKGYFTQLPHIWLHASKVITENIIEDNNRGDNLLLAFDGYPFGVQNDNLLKVADDVEAFVLCDYTPPMNKPESNYLQRRYSDIYYPSVSTSQGTFVRSASARVGLTDDRSADNEYCTRLFKPFMSSNNVQSAVPDREFIEGLLALPTSRSADLIRTSVRFKTDGKRARNRSNCGKVGKTSYYGSWLKFADDTTQFKRNLDDIWTTDQYIRHCDGASWSTGMFLPKWGLNFMSDARAAPIFCQVRFAEPAYAKCPDGWKPFERDSGQIWCHWYSGSSFQRDFDTARSHCNSMEGGAALGGWSSDKELRHMNDMIPNDVPGVWVGAKRKEECKKLGMQERNQGYSKDPSSPCSRLLVFEWLDGVAPNPPLLIPYWMTENEPNYYQADEACAELMKGKNFKFYQGADSTMKLNDNLCGYLRSFFCGKEAPILFESPK